MLRIKKKKLESLLGGCGPLAVAFSGGVDSTFLLAMAKKYSGKRVMAVTVDTPFLPRCELDAAKALTRNLAVPHVILSVPILDDFKIMENTKQRCYFCKRSLLTAIFKEMKAYEIRAVAHGANIDDEFDYRPGARAAKEMGVVAPLVTAGLSKSDIRALSREAGLETWNKPALACLASRIPFGTPITADRLEMIERAEDVLIHLGVSSCRVRHHGTVARIEVPNDLFERILMPEVRNIIVERFRKIGFLHIALDLEGYGSGRMNRGG